VAVLWLCWNTTQTPDMSLILSSAEPELGRRGVDGILVGRAGRQVGPSTTRPKRGPNAESPRPVAAIPPGAVPRLAVIFGRTGDLP
jgi:hypothetical protein